MLQGELKDGVEVTMVTALLHTVGERLQACPFLVVGYVKEAQPLK
jgi:hypothetical protein